MSSHRVSRMRFALQLLLAALVVLVVSCGGSGTGSSSNTVSGRVFDAVTGGPVYGAKVVCPGGMTTASTDSNGNFSFSGSGVHTGTFGVWKGLTYQFMILDNVTVDYSSNRVYNVALTPCSTATYSTYAISGTVPGTPTANGRILVRVYNSDGGWSDSGQVSVTTSSYSGVAVKTRGSNCLVWVVYDNDTTDSVDALNVYYENVSIAATNVLNIATPLQADITVNGGTAGQGFPGGSLVTATYGPISYFAGFTAFTGTSKGIKSSNPANYPIVWTNMEQSASSHGYTARRGAFSAATSQVSSMSLPATPSAALDPYTAGGTMAWDHPSATITFSAVTGATIYAINVSDGSGHSGTVLTNRASLSLPYDLCSDVLDLSASWDGSLTPEWASISDMSVLLSALDTWSTNGPFLENVQYIMPTSSVTTSPFIN